MNYIYVNEMLIMKHVIQLFSLLYIFRERNEEQDNKPLHSGPSTAYMFGGGASTKCVLPVELCIACK